MRVPFRDMTAFTADAARALAGPDWLKTRRASAAERFASTPLPSTEEEVWRYSRISELDLDAYAPAAAGEAAPVPAQIEGALATVPRRAATVVVVNGRLAHLDVPGSGIEVGVLA